MQKLMINLPIKQKLRQLRGQIQTFRFRLHVSRSDGHTNFLIADMLDLKSQFPCRIMSVLWRSRLGEDNWRRLCDLRASACFWGDTSP